MDTKYGTCGRTFVFASLDRGHEGRPISSAILQCAYLRVKRVT